MSTAFSFQLQDTRDRARAGVISTPHGQVETPIFMPVGTLGSVKSLDTFDIKQTQAQIILGNTYHLYLRPGMEVMQQAGGLHAFMGWDKPLLTDSGGFQVFSLAGRVKIRESDDTQVATIEEPLLEEGTRNQVLSKVTDEGVQFISHYDGSTHFFSPEKSMEIQRTIGADIIMTFDECLSDEADRSRHEQAVERTGRWAQQCQTAWDSRQRLSLYGNYQALFGIIQGGTHRDLREKSTEQITTCDFDGIAVGGETVGYNMAGTAEIMSWIEPQLPSHKPRYAMGLGRDPQDLIDAVLMGFDMFDCVGPTRLARNGALYAGSIDFAHDRPTFVSEYAKGRLNIAKSEFAMDFTPISETCQCLTCQQGYSRAYLHHLFRTKELTYYRLASIHNVCSMIAWTSQLRNWIL